MSLFETINSDLKVAMKERQQETVSTLRMLVAALKNKQIEVKKDLTDEETLAALKSQVKQLKDSIESFVEGGREDLAEATRSELVILEKYMPELMSAEALKKVIEETVTELKAAGKKDFGKVMGVVMKKVSGQADGGDVKKGVEEVLGG